ncbi:RHS repeat-associated core domain-containing protein [Roseiconus lacunae]|nr:RHS repeat-associated core domain-containing protein [Roseiconus lacunae]
MTLIPAVLRPGSDPLALTWDFDNRLSSADVDNDGSDDVFYQFDALGRRVSRGDGTTTTVYVPNGQQTVADYTSGTSPSSPTYTYVWGSYIDELVVRDGTGGLRYYHRNQQYSVNALTDSSGGIVERYAYDAYGGLSVFDGSGAARTATAEGNRYTYTGREWDDELSLYHYRARMYDPVSGRFLGRDPIGYVGARIEIYAYCNSNPVAYVDFNGHQRTLPGSGWKEPKTRQECAKKYAWQWPLLLVPNLGIENKVLAFAKCVVEERLKHPRRPISQIHETCLNKVGVEDIKPPTRPAAIALARTYCCLVRLGKGNHQIAPCKYGTHEDDPPGRRPRRFPCWEPSDDDDPVPKSYCSECCFFRSCVDGILPVLTAQQIRRGGRKEFLECKARCPQSNTTR